MSICIFAIAAIVGLCLWKAFSPKTTGFRVRADVTAVIDGSTVDVMLDEESTRVSLSGVKAPAIGRRNADEALMAKQALESRVNGKPILLEIRAADRHGNVSGVIWLDGRNINLELLQWGFVRAVFGAAPEYQYVGAEAKRLERGLWAARSHQATTTTAMARELV